jgi:glycerol-3-phosphate acyltransferase PlsY
MANPAEFQEMLVPLTIVAVSGYLLGSLPFGYLVARSHGVDIFTVGSKSPGATNVRRVLGAGPGNAVFVLDALKGAFAAALPLVLAMLVGHGSPEGLVGTLGYVGLAGALVGHSFSCFTRFRGGKGVATAAGGIAFLLPTVAASSAAVWIIVFYASRFVSLASILAALSLPVAAALTRHGALSIWITSLVAAFVVFRHRSNIRRLLNGTENRFDRKGPAAEEAP